MGSLDGRVAIITGAGRGIGREHALLFAREGAEVVVNDLGGSRDGSGADASAAEQVVEEIKALGGKAVANHDDVASWEGAQSLINTAVESFGDLHVLVNNAGILRDRTVVNMSEDEWDAVIKVHLKGHFAPLQNAAAYWRERSKIEPGVKRAVINTSSTSGLFGQPGQVNYGAAKMGIAAMTMIAAGELARYDVRVNAIAPAALTRLTAGLPGVPDPEKGEQAGPMDPANVSPFVGYLGTENCPITGRVFFVMGNKVKLFQPWAIIDSIEKPGDERWTIAELETEAARLATVPFDLGNWRD
ncbi:MULTISPECIES: SDR family oxidoreductase [Gordonia]|uniref:SDR family oxidoreductase n=1 Tax=Gordonia amicalis TaxID=89053 RepID=A0ABU4DDM0_9ACTN|nr:MULTISPECIES: SDR family oxidoreductase [Gordonia]ATD72295.1 short-chain dehydrogenase [Gordonia sp. 1D]MCR8895993.1 SDR family oxidoreductase [Gordonia sp. GONU]MCZ4651550.1 SDR family oxidoreductase [Gordonia amicalis]MDJ0452583.1 SDR family oxidoreductase [Gordonia amicalis]MDV6307843.1 SDR family oxidoreductase [Gordonia amicalis]